MTRPTAAQVRHWLGLLVTLGAAGATAYATARPSVLAVVAVALLTRLDKLRAETTRAPAVAQAISPDAKP